MKKRIDARIEINLLRHVWVAIAEDAITLTKAIENGLALWLKHRTKPGEDKA
jgi:hypothetical protein